MKEKFFGIFDVSYLPDRDKSFLDMYLTGVQVLSFKKFNISTSIIDTKRKTSTILVLETSAEILVSCLFLSRLRNWI